MSGNFITTRLVQTDPFDASAAAAFEDARDQLIAQFSLFFGVAIGHFSPRDTLNFEEMLDSSIVGPALRIQFRLPFNWLSWLLRLNNILKTHIYHVPPTCRGLLSIDLRRSSRSICISFHGFQYRPRQAPPSRVDRRHRLVQGSNTVNHRQNERVRPKLRTTRPYPLRALPKPVRKHPKLRGSESPITAHTRLTDHQLIIQRSLVFQCGCCVLHDFGARCRQPAAALTSVRCYNDKV
jgi:hypothetical protein